VNAKTVLAVLLGAVVVVASSSCSMKAKRGGGLEAYQAYDRPAKRPQNPAAVSVKVSLSKQRAYVMEGSTMLLAMPVSVGTPSTPTPTGS
jgi:uncharacterized lipoprotein